MLSARDVGLTYGKTVALAGASATVAEGSVVALIGASGSGKSSLLYCLAGLLTPDTGEIRLDDVLLNNLSEDERSELRRKHFGFVFQFAELVPELTLRENIALPLELNGWRRADRKKRVDDLLQQLDIVEQADRRPVQVSGGQAQRAAVARAIVHRPRLLFADEPTGSLDSVNGAIVLSAMLQLAKENGTSVVLVTHDTSVAGQADEIIEMRDGRMVGSE
ncbi:ABC transporter ATP-binding protein [Planosporangium mesophilum]|uniref:ABC transporter ATP-binding protein n=1 Tax=Planosporangium mesophilum TaxID=689768 RepID=A0A8J3X1S2_9ACTN|nr:ABC transporter ATP-binding protein [Planosporangium mesophilum]NJC85393.1 ABC transporter ATP-binding protein [Planosporangium mesophilum]GII24096.1 ABC transporter ATP-binding protein [Planosporangium mesophilum]